MRTLLTLFLSVALSFTGFAQKSAFETMLDTTLKGTVPQITVKQLKSNFQKYKILDAREFEEFIVSHLKNANWLGFNTPNGALLKNINKNTPIVVYCSIGVRSEIMGEKLLKMGFTNVYNLRGSIFEWVNSGNPVYTGNEKETNRVHAYDKKWGKWLKKGNKVYNLNTKSPTKG